MTVCICFCLLTLSLDLNDNLSPISVDNVTPRDLDPDDLSETDSLSEEDLIGSQDVRHRQTLADQVWGLGCYNIPHHFVQRQNSPPSSSDDFVCNLLPTNLRFRVGIPTCTIVWAGAQRWTILPFFGYQAAISICGIVRRFSANCRFAVFFL